MRLHWTTKIFLQVCSVFGLFALATSLLAVAVVEPPGVPNIINANETEFQKQTHFLVFTGSDTAGESATTARAYYNAIDPTHSKRTFQQWLVNAGFISDASQWHPTGKQIVACPDYPNNGCDAAPGYGDNIVNADSHVIVLNAADLGFVRNQFIRCKPNCSAPNPIIYTYLENYPVAPFAEHGTGFSNLTGGSSYPSQAEAAAAIMSALTRPGPTDTLAGCTLTTGLGCNIGRIADVAFEWAPPPNSPTSSTRYGQLYAFVFNTDQTETIGVPAGSGIIGQPTPNLATKTFNPPVTAGDPFPPNLDFLGFKQHPGVCFTCHGGGPKNLTLTGAYPSQGRVDGFRYLPLDVRNLLFTSDLGSESTSRLSQEPQLKRYNAAVLKTVPTGSSTDKDGTVRKAHLREVILGWYAGSPGDTTMSSPTQNADFVPVGWREPSNGGNAPAGSELLYQTVVSPSCRSCHFNREFDLDFGTAATFLSRKSDIKELALLPLCKGSNPKPGNRPMPLAHLTYQKFWQANGTPQLLPSGQPPLTLYQTAERLANYLGYSGTAGFCAGAN